MATAGQTCGRIRGWLRFRLRTLFVLFSLICGVCGREANRLHDRASAIELLSRRHLCVKQELPCRDRPPWSLLPESVYRWSLPWSSHCSSVDDTPWLPGQARWCVRAGGPPTPDPARAEQKRVVAAIAKLTEVDSVLIPFALDDDDLRTLSCLGQLKILDCDLYRLTEAGVACLQKFRKLECIKVRFASDDVSVETIAKLGRLPRLRRVAIACVPAKKSRELEWVTFRFAIDGDGSVETTAKLRRPRRLGRERNGLPAETMARIQAAMPHVEVEDCPGKWPPCVSF
jgi:hypothetical protein